MFKGSRLGRLAVVGSALSVATVGMISVGAEAAEAEPGVARQIYRLEGSNMRSTLPGAAGASTRDREEATDYINTQMRAGRALDISSLRVLRAQVPSVGEVSAIVEQNDSVDTLLASVGTLSTSSGGEAHLQGIGAISHGPASTASNPAAGYNAAINYSRMSRRSRGCRDLWFTPKYKPTYTSQDHHIYDCYEKWQSQENRKVWIYNRYTLFDAANGRYGLRGEIWDATIRFRPWKGYTRRVTGGPYSYAPVPKANCTSYTASFSVGVGGLQIPYMSCSAALTPLPRYDRHSFGVDWDGKTTAAVYLDAAARFYSNGSTPIFADYVWLEVRDCLFLPRCGPGSERTYNTWRDSGW